MKIIKPTCSLETNKSKIKFLENIARTCYQSQDRVSDITQSIQFLHRIWEMGHFSIFEHLHFVFELTSVLRDKDQCLLGNVPGICLRRINNRKLHIIMNLRNALELYYDIPDFLNLIKDQFEDLRKVFINVDLRKDVGLKLKLVQGTTDCEKFYTVRFQISRAVWDELARHRDNSCACESSRYCNYTKDKFGSEIKFSEPVWYQDSSWYQKFVWKSSLKKAEKNYFKLIKTGLSPQFARGVLPMDYSVNCVVTASVQQWKHILRLRTSSKAHPDMQYVMNKAQNLLNIKIK